MKKALPAKSWLYIAAKSIIPCRIAFFLSTFVAIYTSHAKKSVAFNHTLLRITFVKEFSAGCQPRYPVKIPITTWKSLSPPRGLQLYPSCQARCPVKTSNEMEFYPAPSAAQLLTMLLHREHFCSYFYYTQSIKKINTALQILIISNMIKSVSYDSNSIYSYIIVYLT